MILYLDASALVKRYVAEAGSDQVNEAISKAEIVGTALISRAEIAAALAKAVRVGTLMQEEASASLQVFRGEWPDLVRVQVTEMVVARADALAWEHGLWGYDAVHLAAASLWQDAMSERITLSTFDRRLWTAAERVGLALHPVDLPALLDEWKRQDPSGFVSEMRLAAAVKWYEMHHISQAKAAEVAGLSRAEFLTALARYGVSPFQYDADEIVEEISGD